MNAEEQSTKASEPDATKECSCCIGGFFARRRARRAAMGEGESVGPGPHGMVRGRTRRPFLGLLCGLLVMVGVPVLTMTLGASLNEWAQMAIILTAMLMGGMMSLAAIVAGLIVPQLRVVRVQRR